MDVMGVGGRGSQDNVHWTLFKIFWFVDVPLLDLTSQLLKKYSNYRKGFQSWKMANIGTAGMAFDTFLSAKVPQSWTYSMTGVFDPFLYSTQLMTNDNRVSHNHALVGCSTGSGRPNALKPGFAKRRFLFVFREKCQKTLPRNHVNEPFWAFEKKGSLKSYSFFLRAEMTCTVRFNLMVQISGAG